MLLAFWYSASLNDHDSLSMIGRTKGELQTKLEAFDPEDKNAWKEKFAEPEKRVVIYKDGHDLMALACGEGGGFSGASMTMAQFKVRYPDIYAKQ
jgi:hypothetical protein